MHIGPRRGSRAAPAAAADVTDPLDVAALQVPARTIPAPQSVSPEARATLAPSSRTYASESAYPPPDDLDAWRAMLNSIAAASADAPMPGWAERLEAIEATVESIDVGGVPVFDITPATARPGRPELIHLDIHGGALVFGGGIACQVMGLLAADRFQLRTWSVDYRMPPDHLYPAALDDCLTVYRSLVEQHGSENIVVSGGSAGGNLAAALILRARDEGLPLPPAVFLFTPEVDLTESGDTFQTNLGIDTVLHQGLRPINELYAGGEDLAHPYLSPLFGDFTQGFPPTFLQSGTRDLFLSNTVRMHRRLRAAGVAADLHVFEAMPHGGFGATPEDGELDAEVRRYLDTHWPRTV